MKSVLLVYHGGQLKELMPEVKKILANNNVKFLIRERDCLTDKCHRGHDLILVIGGDGTFLRASHFNKNLPMFGINPRPDNKEGFFMQTNTTDYKEKLGKVLKNDFKIIKLLRLKVEINNKKIPEIVLNDVYIGEDKPYTLFNYDLIINNKKEFQRSSGLIISTPAGSNAWIKSAGGQVMNLEDNKFQYISRELYKRRLTKNYKFKKGIMNKNETIEVIPKGKGIVVIDSVSPEYKFEAGDKIKVSTDDNYLNYVKFYI